jgi:hypothetical protein
MLSRAEEYRQRARDCEEAAEAASTVGMHGLFQVLREHWLHLANDVELLDRDRNKPSEPTDGDEDQAELPLGMPAAAELRSVRCEPFQE